MGVGTMSVYLSVDALEDYFAGREATGYMMSMVSPKTVAELQIPLDSLRHEGNKVFFYKGLFPVPNKEPEVTSVEVTKFTENQDQPLREYVDTLTSNTTGPSNNIILRAIQVLAAEFDVSFTPVSVDKAQKILMDFGYILTIIPVSTTDRKLLLVDAKKEKLISLVVTQVNKTPNVSRDKAIYQICWYTRPNKIGGLTNGGLRIVSTNITNDTDGTHSLFKS